MCINDCILYHDNYKDLDVCPVCFDSHYKCQFSKVMTSDQSKRLPGKVVWYFPIIPYQGGYFKQKENQVDVVASQRVLE